FNFPFWKSRWCHFLSLANGDVTCHSPRGGNYRSTLGTRCEMTCDRGYKLLGRSSVQCMPNHRWSGTSHCRQVRCNVLHLIWHGTYHCTQGYVVDSRCDYICEPGYQIERDHSRTCLDGVPGVGQSPSVQVAEPGKLTARVSWDPPVASDTADKTLDVTLIRQGPDTNFKRGINIIRYTAHDQARNRAACKFIVRVEGKAPQSMSDTMTWNNYRAVCEYHCDRGQERRGTSSRVCQFDHNWTEAPAKSMEFKTDVDTASGLLDQLYEKRRLLIVSAPNVAHGDYKVQNLMVQAFRISRSYFNMVLLDKDGLDHERFITPTTSDELFSYIDNNLLDEEERRRLELHGDLCD
uniref:Sushi repeat-containing protein SRPX2 n=1 Tax=Hucho hucho TaxID=62062 RepID=A0A4W5RQH3_9TELE